MRRLAVLGTLLLLVAGCGGQDDQDDPASSATEQAAPETSQAVSVDGNEIVPLARADGSEGRYLLHLPPEPASDDGFPLVLVLHGAPGTPEEMVEVTGFDDLADEEGFVVAYPDSFDAAEDVAVLLDDVEARAPIDPERIYATGFSRGASATYLLTSELTDRIAAFAPVSGVPYEVPPEGPASVLAIQGLADETVTGSDGFVEGWREAAACAPPTVTRERLGNRPARRATSSCAGGAHFVVIDVQRMGHEWPRGATPLVWEFFEDHPLSGAR